MTGTHWVLLFSLFAFFGMCLFAILMGHMINTEWRNADEPIYRTADSGVLSADARAALHSANAPMSAPPAIDPTVRDTRREGTAAALGDMGRKPGTPPTPNPHSPGTLAYFVWRHAYDSASIVCNSQASHG